MADNARLWPCLNSIHKAIAKTSSPNETLLINSGDVSNEMLTILERDYSWVDLVQSPAGTSYYQSKMLGVELATSEIVVFADSDCVYNENWLVGLLSPFKDDTVRVVAGETLIVGTGPIILALSIAHSFDGYSDHSEIYRVDHYYANNVAFERKLLLDTPIPTDLPLYRHGCSLHCTELRRLGVNIWAQPGSRAEHAPPESFSHFIWRFLLFGRDRAIRAKLRFGPDLHKVNLDKSGKFYVVQRRLKRIKRHQPQQMKWIPVGAVILVFSFLLMGFGRIFGAIKPLFAIEHFGAIEGVRYPTVEEFQRSRTA